MQKILDGDEALWEAYRDEAPMLTEMAKLSKVLRQKRKERGAVDFDFPESKIELDENGEPLSIHPHERNDATKLIEDFMLAANETVAQHFYWLEEPFLYRVHDNPDPEKMQQLSVFLGNFGYRLHIGRKQGKRQENGADVQRTFWTGSNTLLPFYVPNQAISRFADSPDYQGVSAGTVKRKAKRALRGHFKRRGKAFVRDGAACGRGGAHL